MAALTRCTSISIQWILYYFTCIATASMHATIIASSGVAQKIGASLKPRRMRCACLQVRDNFYFCSWFMLSECTQSVIWIANQFNVHAMYNVSPVIDGSEFLVESVFLYFCCGRFRQSRQPDQRRQLLWKCADKLFHFVSIEMMLAMVKFWCRRLTWPYYFGIEWSLRFIFFRIGWCHHANHS